MRVAGSIPVAVAAVAVGAGCTTALPYAPPRELVGSIPQDLAEAQIREVLEEMDQADPEDYSRTVDFTDSGLTLYNVNARDYGIVSTYGTSQWRAFEFGSRLCVAFKNAYCTHPALKLRWCGDDDLEIDPQAVHLPWQDFTDVVLWVMEDNEEQFLKALDALSSLGIERAPE